MAIDFRSLWLTILVRPRPYSQHLITPFGSLIFTALPIHCVRTCLLPASAFMIYFYRGPFFHALSTTPSTFTHGRPGRLPFYKNCCARSLGTSIPVSSTTKSISINFRSFCLSMVMAKCPSFTRLYDSETISTATIAPNKSRSVDF